MARSGAPARWTRDDGPRMTLRGGRSLGLATRVGIAGLVVAAVLAVVLVVSISTLREARQRNQQARRSGDIVQAANSVQSLVIDLETGLRGYVITRDRSFLAPYRSARARGPVAVHRLQALVAGDPLQVTTARTLRTALESYTVSYAPLVIRDVGRVSENALAHEGKRRVDGIRALLGRFTSDELARQGRRRAEADRSSRRASAIAVGGLAVLLAVFAGALAYTTLLFVRPVRRLTRATGAVRTGELDARVDEGAPAELGELEQGFNAMAAALEARTAELERVGASRAAMLDAVFSQSPVGLAFFDTDGALLRANAALQAMQGLVAEPAAPDAPPRPALGPLVADGVAHVAATGEPAPELEVAGDAPAGERRWWRVSLFPVHPRGGDIAAIGAVVVDITADRRRADAARRRLEIERVEAQRTTRLDQLGEALGEALTVDRAASVVVSHAIRAVDADAGLLALVDETRQDLVLQTAVGHPIEGVDRWRRISRSTPSPAVEALRRRSPVAMTDRASLSERWPAMAAAGTAAALVLPLALDDIEVGALMLTWTAPRTFAADELTFIARVADRAAQALQRARLYEREHDIAEVLQRSLLPEALPALPGATLASRFRASGTGTLVGGDFYDAFALDDGRWLAWIGDVCGKGPQAAAIAALARYTVRAEARHQPAPSALVATLDDALQRHAAPEERFLTAICAMCEPRPDGLRVQLAVAGHPPPLVLDPEGVCSVVEASGPLIGLPGAIWRDHVLDLAPGARLVLYTDGLTEARAPEYVEDPSELCAAIGRANPRTLEDVLDVLFARAVGQPGALPRDDIALLALEAAVPATIPAPTAG
jgi:serine phosphatase RsbU (regulator of sigma subunit)/CHASE3 domain sensor protein